MRKIKIWNLWFVILILSLSTSCYNYKAVYSSKHELAKGHMVAYNEPGYEIKLKKPVYRASAIGLLGGSLTALIMDGNNVKGSEISLGIAVASALVLARSYKRGNRINLKENKSKKWLQEEEVKLILHEIITGNKKVKVLKAIDPKFEFQNLRISTPEDLLIHAFIHKEKRFKYLDNKGFQKVDFLDGKYHWEGLSTDSKAEGKGRLFYYEFPDTPLIVETTIKNGKLNRREFPDGSASG